MSFNRENVTWQSANGQWQVGFYRVIEGDSFDEDYDPEWDVDYDFDTFTSVSRQYSNEDAPLDNYQGSNPGGTTIVPNTEVERVAKFEKMAAELRARRSAR